MSEIFKDVIGYEGLYQVSNSGRIYSLRKGRFLKPKSNGRGYLQVELTKDGCKKMLYVHRLVAAAFLDNPQSYPEVNHKDENVQNNNVSNLEWCTKRHNLLYGTRVERIVQHFKKAVVQKTNGGEIVQVFDSLASVERLLGFSHSNISRCCNGKLVSAYGYKWNFLEV